MNGRWRQPAGREQLQCDWEEGLKSEQEGDGSAGLCRVEARSIACFNLRIRPSAQSPMADAARWLCQACRLRCATPRPVACICRFKKLHRIHSMERFAQETILTDDQLAQPPPWQLLVHPMLGGSRCGATGPCIFSYGLPFNPITQFVFLFSISLIVFPVPCHCLSASRQPFRFQAMTTTTMMTSLRAPP